MSQQDHHALHLPGTACVPTHQRCPPGLDASGFTLIELLITVAILAVLAAILLPSYQGATSTSDQRSAQLHAQSVRLALNTAIAANPQLNSTALGTVSCTSAADVNANGLTTSAGGNGWEAALPGHTCTATPMTARTYRVTETLADGTSVSVP